MVVHLPLDPKDLPDHLENPAHLETLELVAVKAHPDQLVLLDLPVQPAVPVNPADLALLVTTDKLVVMQNTAHALVVVAEVVADLPVVSVLA